MTREAPARRTLMRLARTSEADGPLTPTMDGGLWLTLRIGAVTASLASSRRTKDEVYLYSIRSRERGKGLASAVLGEIVAAAREEGASVRLTIDPDEAPVAGVASLNKTELLAWYGRAGFRRQADGTLLFAPAAPTRPEPTVTFGDDDAPSRSAPRGRRRDRHRRPRPGR